jgi:hypothetical protein
VGWSGTTTWTQGPRSRTTRTRSPSNACVSARPLSPRRWARVIAASQARILTGLASAGRSTRRAAVGVRHSVATDTETQASRPALSADAVGRGVSGRSLGSDGDPV